MSLQDDLAREVPLADPILDEREREAVTDVLATGMIADGPEVRAFESEFADYCNADHAVACANGTAALHAALIGLGIGPGDTVLTTPLSFVATANAARLAGADVAFADVDPETGNLDPDRVAERLRELDDVAAVVAVHLYGCPADLDPILDAARDHGVALVEDAAQAHGARYRGEPVGAIGDVGTFSFYPTKNMTTGEGGMVVTDREDVRDRVARFVNHGRTAEGSHAHVGHNFRMTSLAAAIGRVQLDRLPGFLDERRENARALTDALAGAPMSAPAVPDHATHAWHQYTVQTDDREAVAEYLGDLGIDTGVYYSRPIHREAPYRNVDRRAPIATELSTRVLSLPVHPGLDREDRQAVVDALESYPPQT